MNHRLAPIAVTMGEPAGIGGEVTLKAWRDKTDATPPFFVIDDPDRLKQLAERIGIAVPIREIGSPADTEDAFLHALPVLPETLDVAISPGTPNPAAGQAVLSSIRRAVAFALDGAASAVVTSPIHKATLYDCGFTHPGHTEFLGELTGSTSAPVMMLACDALKVVPVTIHQSLKSAIEDLSEELILHCARITAASLRSDFGIAEPRIAIAGLNPHAGEDGHMGREEIDIIAPAIKLLAAEGIAVSGPLPPDTMFHDAARSTYDAAICMYHDQALIPLKVLDFASGVNVTLGLPIIRTSPDHGTAFDIAGTGRADGGSFKAALTLAHKIAKQRSAGNANRSAA
jgi:4-hydroxythreonine-4-phosphate dehydrogenase